MRIPDAKRGLIHQAKGLMSAEEAADKYGISRSMVYKVWGPTGKKRAKLSDDDVTAIRSSTERPEVLAERFGVKPRQIYVVRQGLQHKRNKTPIALPGTIIPNGSRLTEEQVREIRANQSNVTGVAMGKKYGISHSIISRIKDGKAYKWVR